MQLMRSHDSYLLCNAANKRGQRGVDVAGYECDIPFCLAYAFISACIKTH